MPKEYSIDGSMPVVHPSVLVRESAVLIGDMILGARAKGTGFPFRLRAYKELALSVGRKAGRPGRWGRMDLLRPRSDHPNG